jgi:hypothetical protein
MKSIENTFELKRNAVIASPSSIFSKVDVITMLEELQAVVLKLIEEEVKVLFTEEELPELKAFKLDVVQAFRRELDDNRYGEYVDQDSAEFQVSYDNRIELSNIDINVEELENALERAFDRVENNN